MLLIGAFAARSSPYFSKAAAASRSVWLISTVPDMPSGPVSASPWGDGVEVQRSGMAITIFGAPASPICAVAGVPGAGVGRHTRAFGGTASRNVGATPIVGNSGGAGSVVEMDVDVRVDVEVSDAAVWLSVAPA